MENPALDALEFFLDNLDDDEILAELRILAEGDDPFQRMFASFVLFKAGDEREKRVDMFVECLETMRGDEIRCAQYLIKLLFETGDDPVFIEKFLTLQSHPNPWNRATVATIAGKFPDAEGVREFLLDSFDDESWEVRSAAVNSLGEVILNTSVYPNDPEIIQRFYDLLDDEDINVASNAINALSNFISLEEELELIWGLIDDDAEGIYSCVHDLLTNLDCSEEVIQFLLDKIDEHNVPLSCSIIGIIGNYGEDAASAVPVLIEMIRPEPSSDVIVVLPREDSLRDSVISALASIGPPAEDAVPILGSMFRTDFDLTDNYDPGARFLRLVICALSMIRGPAVEYLPQIVDVARTSDGFLKIEAIRSISRFGEQAESWGPELIEMVEELKTKDHVDYMDQPGNAELYESGSLLCDALYINELYLALYQIGYEPEQQIDSILSELDGPEFIYAVNVLDDIGPQAIEALPKLREMVELYEENVSVRNQLLNAISRIERLERESR